LLSEGLSSLADTSGKFTSRSVSSLLRGAPDLEPYVKNIESLFETPDAGTIPSVRSGAHCLMLCLTKDADDLVPEPGKHEAYDDVQNEIAELEKQFKAELKKLKSSVECVVQSSRLQTYCVEPDNI
jgi:DNA mismatch repair protein MSH6